MRRRKIPLKFFGIYILINISMILGHIALYGGDSKGHGSCTLDAPRSEVINSLVFQASLLRKNQLIENAFWAAVFTLIVLLGYLGVFELESPV